MKFELICIDMFQTIVDIRARGPFIWKRILGDRYDEVLAIECAKAVTKNVINEFHESASGNEKFINLKTMFKPFFDIVLTEMNVPFNSEDAVNIFMDEHTNAMPYEDVESFFALFSGKLPICLVTDADCEMVLPIINKYEFDKVFISEEAMSYKNDPRSKIFRDVLKHYSIDPSKVLHIGDSSSDISGANRVGIKTCWINRENKQWEYSPTPDYIVTSLNEVADIFEFDNVLK